MKGRERAVHSINGGPFNGPAKYDLMATNICYLVHRNKTPRFAIVCSNYRVQFDSGQGWRNRVFGDLRMEFNELVSMSIDDLWELRQQVSEVLATKLIYEKQELERRLDVLSAVAKQPQPKRRRAYPPVFPKFANPDAPSEVWSGRGKKPRWVVEKLSAGLALQDLSIQAA